MKHQKIVQSYNGKAIAAEREEVLLSQKGGDLIWLPLHK